MNEFQLKYGCNPNQKPSRVFMEDGSDLPFKVLNGRPGYINFLDAFNGWQLVSELKKATGLPAATSFKHVSPAGAAVGLPLNDVEKKIYWVEDMNIEFTSPCQIPVMKQPHWLLREKYRMVLLLLDILRKHSRFCLPRRMVTTM